MPGLQFYEKKPTLHVFKSKFIFLKKINYKFFYNNDTMNGETLRVITGIDETENSINQICTFQKPEKKLKNTFNKTILNVLK